MDARAPLVAQGDRFEDPAAYSTLMGELQHLVNRTHPDIARAVPALSSYNKSPSTLHWQAGM